MLPSLCRVSALQGLLMIGTADFVIWESLQLNPIPSILDMSRSQITKSIYFFPNWMLSRACGPPSVSITSLTLSVRNKRPAICCWTGSS